MKYGNFSRIYIHGWFENHAEINKDRIIQFLAQSEEGLFAAVGSIPGIEIYQYTGKGAGNSVFCFEINGHGDVKLYGRMQ